MLEVAPQVFACGQLFQADLQLIAKQGARSIVNTEPTSVDLAAAALELGITLVHRPVDPGAISPDAAEAFWKVCEELERPLIICSRSGALSTKIWETAEPV